jgi:hypothetical protein
MAMTERQAEAYLGRYPEEAIDEALLHHWRTRRYYGQPFSEVLSDFEAMTWNERLQLVEDNLQ